MLKIKDIDIMALWVVGDFSERLIFFYFYNVPEFIECTFSNFICDVYQIDPFCFGHTVPTGHRCIKRYI